MTGFRGCVRTGEDRRSPVAGTKSSTRGGSDLNQDHVYANQALTHKLNEFGLAQDAEEYNRTWERRPGSATGRRCPNPSFRSICSSTQNKAPNPGKTF